LLSHHSLLIALSSDSLFHGQVKLNALKGVASR